MDGDDIFTGFMDAVAAGESSDCFICLFGMDSGELGTDPRPRVGVAGVAKVAGGRL